MNKILDYLKVNGESLDADIAKALGLPLARVRIELSELTDIGEVMSCHSIKFEKGVKTEGLSCRIAGFVPKAAPGRKSAKVNLKLS